MSRRVNQSQADELQAWGGAESILRLSHLWWGAVTKDRVIIPTPDKTPSKETPKSDPV